MNYFKLIFTVVLLHYGLVFSQCDNELQQLLYQKEGQQFKGQQLFDYIQNLGLEVFSGQKGDEGWNNLLNDKPVLNSLTYEKIIPWKELIACGQNWYRTVSKRLELKPDIVEIMNQGVLNLTYLSNEMLSFSQQLKDIDFIELNEKINELGKLYLVSLSQLPDIAWRPRTPEEIFAQYKKETGISFDPKPFFEAYKKIRVGKKGFNIDDIFYFLQAISSSPFQFRKEAERRSSDLQTVPDRNQRRNHAATVFVNMMEELVSQSKQYKPKYFWSSKPKGLLNVEEQRLAQEIINALYILFPAMKTTSVLTKIKFTIFNADKAPLLIFAESRILLIVLRAYLRKAQNEQKK